MIALYNTIEDCWDHEPDARLHALCLLNRLEDFKAGIVNDQLSHFNNSRDDDRFFHIWNRRNSGVSSVSSVSSGFIDALYMERMGEDSPYQKHESSKEPLIVQVQINS